MQPRSNEQLGEFLGRMRPRQYRGREARPQRATAVSKRRQRPRRRPRQRVVDGGAEAHPEFCRFLLRVVAAAAAGQLQLRRRRQREDAHKLGLRVGWELDVC